MSQPSYEGCVSRHEQLVRNLLGDCLKTQDFLGVATAALALEHIYDEQLPEPPCEEDGNYTRQQLRDLRPFILVYSEHGTPTFIRRAANPSSTTTHYISDVIVELEREIPEQYCDRPDWAYRDMVNHVGLIGQEMLNKSGLHPYPSIHRIVAENVCTLAHPQEYERLGNYAWARLRIIQEES